MLNLNLVGLTLKEIEEIVKKEGFKTFCAKQIWNWIYVKNCQNFANFSNLSKDLRQKLQDSYSITPPKISQDLLSKDGTRKWLVQFSDCKEVEMVFIPEEKRGTLCISSQIGCTLTCKFCHTGTQRLVRNLKAGEIIWQFLLARNLVGKEKITNIVFMGMGEPLFNFDHVKQAIQIINDKNGLNFSKRRITLSTSGLVPEILKFCDEINSGLAISLHACNDDLRNEIMPINKKYPLKELIKSCQYYQKNNSQKITFEYVMLRQVNDSDEDAFSLVKLIKNNKLNCKVNLIPFNPWEGAIYECSSRNRIMSFAKILKNNNIEAPIRKTRGQDVMAACGQLKSLSQSKKLIRD